MSLYSRDVRVIQKGQSSECWGKNQEGLGVNDRQSVFTAHSYFVQINESEFRISFTLLGEIYFPS